MGWIWGDDKPPSPRYDLITLVLMVIGTILLWYMTR